MPDYRAGRLLPEPRPPQGIAGPEAPSEIRARSGTAREFAAADGFAPPNSGALRVAQLANYVGPASGGLRVVVEQLGRMQLSAGWSRLLVLPAGSDSPTGTGRDQRLTVASPPLPRAGGRYRVLVRRAPVIDALEAFGPDVVEVHDQTTLAWVADWARSHGVRSVLFSHERLDLVLGEAAGLPARWLDGVARRWSARLAESFDTVVCASSFAAEPFAGLGCTHLHVIPFGVDLDTFAPVSASRAQAAWSPPAAEDPLSQDTWRLIFAGRMHPEKAPGLALDVLARLRDAGRRARLLMVGSGPLESALRRRVAREQLPVHFVGHVSGRADLAALLASADVALAPGPRETFGLGVLEAMACGTPVVVSSRGASSELIAPGAGGAGGTADELAAVVCGLLQDPFARAESRLAARARAAQFPWSATARALEEAAYRPALPAAGPSPRRRRKVQNR